MAKFSKAIRDDKPVQPCEEKDPKYEPVEDHWIEIELTYEHEGEPVPHEEYLIKLPSGAEVRGFLNEDGWARVHLIEDPGNCEVSYPALDEEAWESA